MKRIEEAGKRYGRLLVLEHVLQDGDTGRRGWRCVCDCGKETLVASTHLRTGHTKSCGCLRVDECSLPLGEALVNSILCTYTTMAKKFDREFLLTRKEFSQLIFGNCFYCGTPPLTTKRAATLRGELLYNGIDRVDNSLGYIKENCVPCCKTCNLAKRTLSKSDFLSWIDRVYKHQHRHTDMSMNPISNKFYADFSMRLQEAA